MEGHKVVSFNHARNKLLLNPMASSKKHYITFMSKVKNVFELLGSFFMHSSENNTCHSINFTFTLSFFRRSYM